MDTRLFSASLISSRFQVSFCILLITNYCDSCSYHPPTRIQSLQLIQCHLRIFSCTCAFSAAPARFQCHLLIFSPTHSFQAHPRIFSCARAFSAPPTRFQSLWLIFSATHAPHSLISGPPTHFRLCSCIFSTTHSFSVPPAHIQCYPRILAVPVRFQPHPLVFGSCS
jgi:hypothetical protein